MPKALQGFFGSLVLLVAALGAFFSILFVVFDSPTTVEPASPQLEDVLAESKRQAMRSAHWGRDPGYLTGGTSAKEVVIKLPPAGKIDPVTATNGQPVADDADPFDDEISRAINLIDNGSVQEAISVLDGVLKKDPRNEQALVELAMINLLDLKQPEAAMGYLQRVVEVNPRNQIVMSELVSLFEEQGRVDDGITFMAEVFQKNPESTELAFGIGQMLSLQGRDSEAIQYLEKAAASPDNYVRANRELGEAYTRSGDAEKAIEAYNRAIAEQERDIAEKAAKGLPTQFAEESMAFTKMDKAKNLIDTGKLDEAQQMINEIGQTLAGDQSVVALQESLNRRRRGG
jgi:tetratricopeptide (TPR) repeat protein